MKYLKLFEEFGEFQMDEISKEEYYSILNNRLVYIPESKVLEFKSKLSKEYKLGYGRASVKDTVEFFRAEYETEIDYHITSKRFSIKKKSLVDDEPCYIMSYHYEEFTSFAAPQSHIETLPNQERIFFEKKSYYRFEESDFNQMCENPQILLDYLEKKNMIKESFEYHGQKYAEQICDLWGVIDLEDLENLFLEFGDEGQVLIHPMIVNKEIKVTVHKIWQELNDSDWLYNPLWDSRFESIKKQLNRLGLDLNVETKNLNQRFVSVRIFPMSDRKRTHSKTDIVKESLFSEIPDPEPMDVNEWDEEVNNAQELAFTQKEKELFIGLSDLISLKNKRNPPDIGKSNLFFQMINGDLNPVLRDTTPIRNISTYKNDDEYYYVGLWGRDDGIEWNGVDDKLYRCDGYECWEKFLKEIFAGYRKLIS